MRVVIVGGAGFIGTALAQALATQGAHPVVLDTAARLANAAKLLPSIETASFDFTSSHEPIALLAGADAMVHLACTTNPAHSMNNIAWDVESNIPPSIRLFEAAVAAGIRRVVFASSGGTVYGAPAHLPVSETHPTRPLCAYGISKLAIEHYLALFPALRGISLRIANPYGPHQLAGSTVGVIARFVSAVRRRSPIEVWGDGSIVRDYIAIEDVVDAFLLAIVEPELPAGAYNIGTSIGSSVNEVLAAVFDASGYQVPVTYTPGRAYDVPAIALSSERFMRVVPWKPRTPLAAGVASLWRAARSFR